MTLLSAARYIRRVIKALLGLDHLIAPDVRIPKTKLGTEYGGWVIADRLLRNKKNAIVYSVGLGRDISFDLALIENFNCFVYGFDPTPRSLTWLAEQHLPSCMQVLALGIASYDGEASFAPPDNPQWDSFSTISSSDRSISCSVLTFRSMMKRLGHGSVDVLKMDVEGSEYEVIEEVLKGDFFPNQFLIEFHHGLHGIRVQKTRDSIELLRRSGYRLFDVSLSGREMSFVHCDAIARAKL